MARRSIKEPARVIFPGVFAAAIIGVLFAMPSIIAAWMYVYEDAMIAIAPSAERAYEYGNRHLDAQRAHSYDIDRAEYFFDKALTYDPALPYLNHQIARVAFLRADFSKAMVFIDREIQEHPEHANAYYVRGLIEGYMGDYAAAAKDYEQFLKVAPYNWAAINDYAWVLLKDGRAKEAATATEEGLKYFPENPWLLNSSAIALYEIGDIERAHERVQKAWDHVQAVGERDWLHSYPGNDPAIAEQGIATFRAAISENMHRIESALAGSAVP